MAEIGLGVELQRSDDGTPTGVFTKVGCLKSLDVGFGSIDLVDVTSACDTDRYRKYVKGLIDTGEISAELSLDPTSASFAEFIDDLESPTNGYYHIVFPSNSATLEFEALMTGMDLSVPFDAEMTYSITLKMSGKPILTVGSV